MNAWECLQCPMVFSKLLCSHYKHDNIDWEQAPCINSDAVFIADAHFVPLDLAQNKHSESASKALLDFFDEIFNIQTNIPSQIFLMGDIAHLLLGTIPSSHKTNQMLLKKIESLSLLTQIWWFEGNHDFRLDALYENHPFLHNIRIIPRTHQPKAFTYKCQNQCKLVLLAHGDIFLNKKYEAYIRFMNAKITGLFLLLLDKITFGKLYAYAIKKVNRKDIKLGKADIVTFSSRRIKDYHNFICRYTKDTNDTKTFDAVIEGHFHIGKTHKNKDNVLYISLPSFYIGKSILNVESLIAKNLDSYQQGE